VSVPNSTAPAGGMLGSRARQHAQLGMPEHGSSVRRVPSAASRPLSFSSRSAAWVWPLSLYQEMRFNTAISAMMEFVNAATKWGAAPRELLEPFTLLLAPYAPHIAEEFWSLLGHEHTLTYVEWPLLFRSTWWRTPSPSRCR
jgi:hypothetical protein